MFAAKQIEPKFLDATGLPRGVSRLLLFSGEREAPRHKAVASNLLLEYIGVATNVIFHGTSPWHLRLFVQSLCDSLKQRGVDSALLSSLHISIGDIFTTVNDNSIPVAH